MRDFRKKWALAPAWLRIWCIVAVPLAPLAVAATFIANYNGSVPIWVGLGSAVLCLTPWGVLSQAPWDGTQS
ncbi:hypothetical protein GCM10009623_36640 [Nocardioides aestuarii]|uniref:Uncharacterized protein n=1 Tax=Nocardioides aestuarii TaxID=252231 RepID=A0ABW4TSQ1_9ACTN